MSGSGKTYESECDKNPSIAALQTQATKFCLKSKSFLCSHYVSPATPEGMFSDCINKHIKSYRTIESNKNNQAMKWLYSSADIDLLCQQIGMLTMHAQFKDVEDIANVEKEIEERSLNTDSVAIALGVYVYFTILVNNNLDELSYNELFIKSWYNYYSNWMTRRLIFKMSGNNWKDNFKGVLLE